MPVFALANAGIDLSADAIADPSAVLVGVAVGLVVGKLVGVTSFSWFAVRLGLGRLPDGVRWGHIVGVASVAGIGFTVSLFITDLAFDSPALQDDAKIGTLAASVVAAFSGATVLVVAARLHAVPRPPQRSGRVTVLRRATPVAASPRVSATAASRRVRSACEPVRGMVPAGGVVPPPGAVVAAAGAVVAGAIGAVVVVTTGVVRSQVGLVKTSVSKVTWPLRARARP